jgi:hypothetical protein
MEKITREWLDDFLEAKMPRVLKTLQETHPVPVVDLVKLAQFERRKYPAKLEPRVVIWRDRMDPPEPEEEPETEWDNSETKWRD